MKILFANLSPLKFSVATPDNEPLGGSESCVSYLARQLAANGHDVTLMARLPDDFSVTAYNVKHQPLSVIKDKTFFDTENFDVIVAANAPVACPHFREVSPKSKIILWDHVPPEQPSMAELGNPAVQEAIDLIVYVSSWQMRETEKRFGITKASVIIGNGLTPAFENLFSSADEILRAKQNRAAYTTIPYRGLPILLGTMNGLKEDMKLDVFSSMRVYQMSDDEHADIYREAEKDPRITLHGSVSQKELAQRLKPAAFLTYPCVLQETFCIAALEAMAAGMKVIATRLGALETTTMGYADLIDVTSDRAEDLVPTYRAAVEKNIAAFKANPKAWSESMFEQVKAVNEKCGWKLRTKEWEQIFLTR